MSQARRLEFKIAQLRQDKIILILETIAVFILALFVSVFLPQLLFQFVFSTQELTAEPAVLRYIPVVSFVGAILYFVYATVMCLMKKMKIMQLEKELSLMMTDDSCGCDCGDCSMGDHAHHESFGASSDTARMSAALAKKSPAKKKASKRA